jgi:hypothetical protein
MLVNVINRLIIKESAMKKWMRDDFRELNNGILNNHVQKMHPNFQFFICF